jgi:hypothetical protein
MTHNTRCVALEPQSRCQSAISSLRVLTRRLLYCEVDPQQVETSRRGELVSAVFERRLGCTCTCSHMVDTGSSSAADLRFSPMPGTISRAIETSPSPSTTALNFLMLERVRHERSTGRWWRMRPHLLPSSRRSLMPSEKRVMAFPLSSGSSGSSGSSVALQCLFFAKIM